METSAETLPFAPLAGRPMPAPLVDEPAGYRWAWLAVGLAVVALYAVVVFTLYAPGDRGVDENAYLVGGRLIAEHGTPRYALPDPYAYTGGMFVRMPTGAYYPKYPFGLPLLYACFFWVLGPDQAPVYAFLVSPASAVMAVMGTFLLARAVAGSFAAVMAATLLGTSQVMLSLANDANSHAACAAFIVWGMFLLVRWWQTGRLWQGWLAGFLIGYAATIRYTEGLLVLPIALACLTRIRWRGWTGAAHASAVVAVAGAVGVVCLRATAAHVAAAGALSAYAAGVAVVTRDRWRQWVPVLQATAVAAVGAAFWLIIGLWTAADWDAVAAAGSRSQHWFGPGRTSHLLAAAGLVACAAVAGGIVFAAAGRRARPFIAAWWAFAREVAPGLAWCVPVATLVVFNSATMRHPAGYDTTHESELGVAFKWSFLVKNWELVVRTFDDLELFFVIPLAVVGLGLAFRRSWRVGLLLLSWVVPGVLLYGSYYWSMDFDVAYARFFLTFLPALCVAAAVAFHDGVMRGRPGGTGGRGALRHWAPPVQATAAAALLAAFVLALRLWTPPRWGDVTGWHHWFGPARSRATLAAVGLVAYAGAAAAVVAWAAAKGGPPVRAWWPRAIRQVPGTVVVGLVVAIASGVSAHRSLLGMRDGEEKLVPLVEGYRGRLNLARVGQELLAHVPARSVLFAPASGGFETATNYVQFLRDWDLFQSDTFTYDAARRGMSSGTGKDAHGHPVAMPDQPEQAAYHASLYRGKSLKQLAALEAGVIDAAFAHGRRVFALLAKEDQVDFDAGLDRAGTYTRKPIAVWKDVSLPVDPRPADDDDGEDDAFNPNGPTMLRVLGISGQHAAWRLIEILPGSKK